MKRKIIILLTGLIAIAIAYYSFPIVSTNKDNNFRFSITLGPKGDSILTTYDDHLRSE
jgi:hypothetical protein